MLRIGNGSLQKRMKDLRKWFPLEDLLQIKSLLKAFLD
jgi:hypothetical protein